MLTVWDFMLWLSIAAEVGVLVLATRAYVSSRRSGFAFLLVACASFVIGRMSWFLLPLSAGFILGHPHRAFRVWATTYLAQGMDITCHLLALLSLGAALLAFRRGTERI